MKRRLTIMVSLVALVMLLLSGCSSNKGGSSDEGGSSSDKVTKDNVKGSITMLTQRTDLQQDGTLKKYADAFKKEYPSVTDVKFEAITNYADDVKTRLNSGNAGDVLMIPTSIELKQFPEFFVSLDDLGLDDKTYFGKYDAYQGHTYGLASGVNSNGLVYNKQAFQKAGITAAPTTLNEFYADCAKLKAAGITPVALNYTDKWPLGVWDQLSPNIAGDAGYLNTLATKKDPFTADSPIGQALNIPYTIVQKGYAEPNFKVTNWEQSKTDFATGKTAMMVLGNWAIPQFESKGISADNVGFVPFPYSPDTKTANATIGPDYFYAVSKNSKNIPTAKAFIKFMIEKSGYAKTNGFIPPLKSIQPSLPQLSEFENTGVKLMQSVPGASQLTAVANAAQVDIGGGGYMQSLLTAKSFSAALQNLNKEWDNGIAQAGQ